ncbi:hypothetical protein, partial [Bifidobacterium animalis]|uniref:hypothetical protein n=1 Tax=Bifidobacterium animalis TaxID=28025 RepID=UPI003F913650
WTGPSQANGSSNFSMPWNTLNKAYNHKDVLQRPLESAFPLRFPCVIWVIWMPDSVSFYADWQIGRLAA